MRYLRTNPSKFMTMKSTPRYAIHGGSVASRMRQALRLGSNLSSVIQLLQPFLGEVGKQVLEQSAPALASVASDKLSQKGLSSVGDLLASATQDGVRSVTKGDRQSNFVADMVADQLNKRVAKTVSGSGSRRIGSGSRRMGGGSRLLGEGYFKSLGSGSSLDQEAAF